jgi:cysteine synthase/SAM-dependent methyltransferase
MYSRKEIENTLDESYMTEYLIQAQWAEMIELKKIINELARELGRKLNVLDIGIGDGRVPKILSKIKEIWNLIAQYDGIDNSEIMLKKAKLTIESCKLGSKVRVFNLDARDLLQLKGSYDLILCTYFTAGDFIPDDFSFETDKDGKLKVIFSLEKNTSFEKVFRSAFDLLVVGGKLVLGSIYMDTDSTREKQEEFYKKCGMTIITRPTDSFTATREGFWSQRFTEKRIIEYFNFVRPENIELRFLDDYNFAQMVIVSKKKSIGNHMALKLYKADGTPLVRYKELGTLFNIPNLLVKDESKNPFGTFKDRRSELVIDRAKDYVDKLVLITSGNAGYSLARFAEGTNIKVVCVVDKISHTTRNKLEKFSYKVIDLDLSKKIFGPEEVIAMARESDEEVIWDVTNGFHQAFQSIVREIKTERPDWLIVPLGSGETFVGLYGGLKRFRLKTKLVGVGVKGPSIADKLYTPWTPYKRKIEAILKEGHQYIQLSEEQIKDAYEKVRHIISCEPSSSVVFGALPKLGIDSKDKVIVVNSGKGLI